MVMHCTFEWILYWMNDIISLKINLLLHIYLGMTYRQQRNQFKYSFVCDNDVESSFVSGCCKTIDFFHSATQQLILIGSKVALVCSWNKKVCFDVIVQARTTAISNTIVYYCKFAYIKNLNSFLGFLYYLRHDKKNRSTLGPKSSLDPCPFNILSPRIGLQT